MRGRRRAAAALGGLFARLVDAPAKRRVRIGTERALSVLSALLAVTTLLWHGWIEVVLRVDPDSGSGALEWAVVGACAATSVAFAVLAQREARKPLVPLADR
ncbi:MAG TPA: hypothetical protein VFI01_07540 [Gaiellaceae bacterium]|nr:hypothetical protein [Gaiellaceae bacterium]